MFRERLAAGLEVLSTTGMWRSSYAPPAFRFMWWCNLRIRPPHFRSFRDNAIMHGAYFGIGWTTLMWLFIWRGSIPATAALGSGAVAGLLFGLSMATYYQHGRRKYALPDWESLSDD